MPQPDQPRTARTPEAQGSSLSLRCPTHGTLDARLACPTPVPHNPNQVDGSRPVIFTGARLPVLEAASQ